MSEGEGRANIARLNDEFRHAGGGVTILTAGLAALPTRTRDAITNAVRDVHHDAPDSEHQVGSLLVDGHEVIWFILYYRRDRSCTADVDPMDALTTGRALAIMLAEEP